MTSARDLPNSWRSAWTVLGLVGGVLAAGLTGAAGGLAAVRSEAERVVSKAWNERQRAEVVSIATEAARAGATAAISDQFERVISPLSGELKAHESMDDERERAVEKRVDRVEMRLDRIEGIRRVP